MNNKMLLLFNVFFCLWLICRGHILHYLNKIIIDYSHVSYPYFCHLGRPEGEGQPLLGN